MIEIRNLHKKFKDVHALKGIDLSVRKGEIYGFIGKNGAGKTTTMDIIAGLSKPLSGTCIVNGQDVSQVRNPGALSIGYLPESPSFYGWMTVRESLEYLADKSNQDKTTDRINQLLLQVGLKDVANRRIGGFSKGMKQRLGICQILMHEPELLILDEPSSALDPEGRTDILNLIQTFNKMGQTIIFSTHILSDVEKICDTVGMIDNGRILMQKPLDAMLQHHLAPTYDIELMQPIDDSQMLSLQKYKSISTITRQDNLTLSVVVNEAAIGSQELIAWFSEQKLSLRSMTLRKHSLEDLFVREVNAK